MYLHIFSCIIDIQPGSEYSSDERNKLSSFFKRSYFKGYYFSIRMCSTESILWKNQKGSTRYPMILYKWDSTADIFLWMFNFFSYSSIDIEVIRTVYCYYFFFKMFFAQIKKIQALFKYLNTPKKNIISKTSNFHLDVRQ